MAFIVPHVTVYGSSFSSTHIANILLSTHPRYFTIESRESRDTLLDSCLRMAGIIFLLSLCCFAAVAVANEPQLPTTYHATGTIYLPKGDIAEPYEAWVDNDKGMSRFDYYGGKVDFVELNCACHVDNYIT